MAKQANLRKDFEIFKRGIERLEELKAELNALNARGHEAEAASIRIKLKNVSDIPLIESELRRLKLKISGRYKPSKKPSQTKKKINKLEGQIGKLERELQKKAGLCKTGGKNAKYIKDIPKIESQIAGLRSHLYQHKKDEERKKEILKRIDPSVEIVSDEIFDMSLNEIKAQLSENIKKKETEMQKQLQEDLMNREEAFQKKYNDLEKKFHEDYEENVQKHLNQDVKDKFQKLLNQKIGEKKVSLSKKELDDLRKKTQKEFDLRREELISKMRKDINESKKMMKQHLDEELLMHKHSLHRKFEQDVADEIRNLEEKEKSKEKEIEGEVESEKEKFRAEKETFKREMQEEKERKIHAGLVEKTEEMRRKLQKEYEEKLKDEMRKRELELEKKKLAFEEEIKRRAKEFFH